MNKMRVGFLRLLGMFYGGVGLYILYAAVRSGQASLSNILVGAGIAAGGFVLVWRAENIVKAQPPETYLQKTITRRILVFTGLMVGYLILAAYIAVRADMRGINIRRIMIIEAIGFAAVIGAYIYLLHQIINQRKNNRIQDPVLAKRPLFEQNRPFHLLVKEIHDTDGRISVTGRTLGTLSPRDAVWILAYGSAMRVSAENVISHEAETELILRDVPNERLEDAVITTRIPYRYINTENPFANAELSALLEFVAGQNSVPPEMMLRIAWLAAHGTFLVRTIPEPADTWYKKLNRWLFGYTGTFSAGTVHRENSDEEYYAAYTDWDAYNRHKNEEGTAVRENAAMVISFPQMMQWRKTKPGGVVLNPFGPVSFLLSEALLDHIMEQSWYRKDIAGEQDSEKTQKNA